MLTPSFIKITTSYPDGRVDEYVKEQDVCHLVAFRSRVRRLREARTKHTVDRETLTIDIPAQGQTDYSQKLEYSAEAPC